MRCLLLSHSNVKISRTTTRPLNELMRSIMTDQIIEIIHKKLISSTLISEISLSIPWLYTTSLCYKVINRCLLNKQGNCRKQQTSASQLFNKQSKAGNFEELHVKSFSTSLCLVGCLERKLPTVTTTWKVRWYWWRHQIIIVPYTSHLGNLHITIIRIDKRYNYKPQKNKAYNECWVNKVWALHTEDACWFANSWLTDSPNQQNGHHKIHY